MPYVEKLRIDKKCQVVCSTFHNNLFRNQYPEIEFTRPGTTVYSIYTLYRLGIFMNGGQYDVNTHPIDPRKVPLMKVASDILGLPYREIKPKLPILTTEKKKVVSIGVHATANVNIGIILLDGKKWLIF